MALSVLTQRSCPGPGMGRGWGGMHKSGCSQGSSPDPEPSVGCPKATFGLVSTLPTQAAGCFLATKFRRAARPRVPTNNVESYLTEFPNQIFLLCGESVTLASFLCSNHFHLCFFFLSFINGPSTIMKTTETRAEGNSPQPPHLLPSLPSPCPVRLPLALAPSKGDFSEAASLQSLCLQPGFHMTMSWENFSQMIHESPL